MQANLVFLEPLLNELFLALSQDGPTELESLVFVQLTALQENPEILEEGRSLPGRGGHLLESQNGVCCAKNTLQVKGERGETENKGRLKILRVKEKNLRAKKEAENLGLNQA